MTCYDWIYNGTLPSLEDETRYTAPPEEPSEERREEPEDHCDYIDTLSENDQPETKEP